MKRPKINCGCDSDQTPPGELMTIHQIQIPCRIGGGGRQGRGGDTPPHSSRLNAFDRCSWTIEGTGRKNGHPNFLNMAAPLFVFVA